MSKHWGYAGIFFMMLGNVADAVITGIVVSDMQGVELNPILSLGFNTIGVGLTLIFKILIGTFFGLLLIEAYNKLHSAMLIIVWLFGLFFWSLAVWGIANVLVVS